MIDLTGSIDQTIPADDVPRAACVDTDPEAWFPDFRGTDAPTKADARLLYLRRVCNDCPLQIRRDCLKTAIDAEGTLAPGSRFGVFAGTTPKMRARIAHLLGLKVDADPDVQGDLFDLEATS